MKVAFLGDLHCSQFEKVALPPELMAKSGVTNVVVNFEGSISEEFQSGKYDRVRLGQSVASLSTLAQVDSFIAGMANNHVCDLGSEAVAETIRLIEGAGGRVVGIGESQGSALAPVVMETGGERVALFALTVPEIGSNTGDLEDACRFFCGNARSAALKGMVNAEKCLGGLLVAFVHWDMTNHSFPSPLTRRLAHDLLSAGFDAVIGHHPHVIQGLELVNGKPVYYSLGNFAFDSYVVNGKAFRLPQSNMSSICVIYDVDKQQFRSFGVLFDPKLRVVRRNTSADLRLKLLSLPFVLGRFYGIFYRMYLVWRLGGRAVYWAKPSRLAQANGAQWRALKLAIRTALGRK